MARCVDPGALYEYVPEVLPTVPLQPAEGITNDVPVEGFRRPAVESVNVTSAPKLFVTVMDSPLLAARGSGEGPLVPKVSVAI